ncbi:MAG: hypothetical protein ABEK50_05615, partial [bacterium]
YRDTNPLLSDWKDSSTLVTTIGSRSDTDYTDNNVLNGDTYYYRITVVDDPAVDGGDGVADYENESFFSDTSGAQPANSGPTWFVNKTVDDADSFTTAAGYDTNTGSSYEPFARISQAIR